MLYENRERAESFGGAAERYDRARPIYPPELVAAVVGAGRPEVVDVGCGTGIAARLLTAAGAYVVGVEIDPRMAEVARRSGVAVQVASWEDWDPAGRRFDRVTAGQAWHWVDPVAGAAKAAAVLRPGGRLCPFWNVLALPDELLERTDADWRRLVDGRAARSTGYQAGRGEDPREGIRDELDGMAACTGLGEAQVRTFAWSRTYTRDEWLDQLPTHSDVAVLAPAGRAELLEVVGAAIDGLGGAFEASYRTVLVEAERLDPPAGSAP